MELYLEAHVTISPIVDGKERERAAEMIKPHGFKLAHLVMIKGGREETSKRDTFMTGHGKNVDDLAARTRIVVELLRDNGFKVWRHKIESCVIDSRQQGDKWGVLDPDRPELPLIACDGCARVA